MKKKKNSLSKVVVNIDDKDNSVYFEPQNKKRKNEMPQILTQILYMFVLASILLITALFTTVH